MVCSDIPPFREIGGDHVCFFDLNDTPEQIAAKILGFLSTQKSHQFFKHVLRNYAWDNIYHYRLLPILQRVIEAHRASPT